MLSKSDFQQALPWGAPIFLVVSYFELCCFGRKREATWHFNLQVVFCWREKVSKYILLQSQQWNGRLCSVKKSFADHKILQIVVSGMKQERCVKRHSQCTWREQYSNSCLICRNKANTDASKLKMLHK